MKIIRPIIKEIKLKIKTAAAAKSFIFPAIGWKSGLTKSTKYSIDELIVSNESTIPMHNNKIIHSS